MFHPYSKSVKQQITIKINKKAINEKEYILMVVLTASQNLKLLDSVDVEDRRRHGKIRSTMISDTGSYQGQIPLTEWSGERNSEQT